MTIGKFSWRQVVTYTICFLALGIPVEGQEEDIVVGVVPFVASPGVGNAASGVAEKLVQRLTTSGLKDVRLLSNFESLGKNEVDAKEVERAAKESGVDLLVLGRAAKLGNRLSLDGEVRSGVTGQRIGTPFFVETPAEEDLVGSVDALASRVMEQIPNSLKTVASSGSREAPSLLSKDSDDPVSIKSRELEAIEDDLCILPRPDDEEIVLVGHDQDWCWLLRLVWELHDPNRVLPEVHDVFSAAGLDPFVPVTPPIRIRPLQTVETLPYSPARAPVLTHNVRLPLWRQGGLVHF